eukprot:403344913
MRKEDKVFTKSFNQYSPIQTINNGNGDKDDLLRSNSSQYKVFKLGPEGPEEINFVEWASDLNRNHPIAKQYQAQRKNFFDQIRKERAAIQVKINQGIKTPSNVESTSRALSTSHSRGKSDRITPNSNKISRNYFSPLIRLQTTSTNFNTRNQTTLRKGFNIKLESTTTDASPIQLFKTQSTFKSAIHQNNQGFIANLEQPGFTPLEQQSNYTSLRRFNKLSQGDTRSLLNKSCLKNLKSENPLTNNFDISKSKLVSQVRKHLNLVSHFNNYENKFLDSKDAAQFQTQNPINVYYQIAQNPDYCFNPSEILQPASKIDVQQLRENYKTSCHTDSRAARFEKSDYEPIMQPMTSYQGKRKQIVLEKQKRSISMMSQYEDQVRKDIQIQQKANDNKATVNLRKSQESIMTKSTLKNNQSVMSFKPRQSISSISKLSRNVLKKHNQSVSTTQQPKTHNESINDFKTEEPEFPLTGYNYKRYFNEGSLLMNVTMSAHKINNMLELMDKNMIEKRQQMHRFKYDVLINSSKKVNERNRVIERLKVRVRTPDITSNNIKIKGKLVKQRDE